MADRNTFKVRCPCGKKLMVKSRSGIFQCPVCGKQLRLSNPKSTETNTAPPKPQGQPPPPPAKPPASTRPANPYVPKNVGTRDLLAPHPNAPVRSRNKTHQKQKRKKLANQIKWNVGDWISIFFVSVVVLALVVASVFLLIPNAIRDFQTPSADQFAMISGRPVSMESNRVVNRRGTYTTFSFKVADRGFFLPSYDFGDDEFEKIERLVRDCQQVQVTVVKDKDRYSSIPFWELKGDGQVIVSKQSIVERHQRNRYGSLLAPIVLVSVVFIGGAISAFSYFRKRKVR